MHNKRTTLLLSFSCSPNHRGAGRQCRRARHASAEEHIPGLSLAVLRMGRLQSGGLRFGECRTQRDCRPETV